MAVYDHNGVEFPSKTKMCEYYGLSPRTFASRIRLGWGLEKALSTPPGFVSDCCVAVADHLGNEFSSVAKMCEHYGISRGVFAGRIRHGWGLEKALSTPPGFVNSNRVRIDCVAVADHLGNEFSSVTKLCEHYGIPTHVYYERLHSGWDLERILTEPIKQMGCVDHLGKKYSSIDNMLAEYGISRVCYRYRLSKGWSLERILTTAPWEIPHNVDGYCCDHLGNEFPSIDAMLREYEISYSAYKGRRDKGWSLERCLTEPIRQYGECSDHVGNVFSSKAAMYRHYGISRQVVSLRKQKGWTLEQILTTPVREVSSALYGGDSATLMNE